jgi:hypothetical protein
MQFLPACGGGKTAFDTWVRDVRLRLVGILRSQFMDVLASRELQSLGNADLKRAAVLLLEADPHDHEVRRHLAAGLTSEKAPPVAVFPITQSDSAPQRPLALPEKSSAHPRIALLPPLTSKEANRDGSIANAVEKHKGWLGYYWAPTAILGKYDMVKLSLDTSFDKAEWDRCTSVADCADPRVNDYPVTDVYSVVTKNFADKAGVAMDYVGKRQWDNATVGKVLAWMSENQADNADAAKYFLKTYPQVWTAWVSPEVAEKVKADLLRLGSRSDRCRPGTWSAPLMHA